MPRTLSAASRHCGMQIHKRMTRNELETKNHKACHKRCHKRCRTHTHTKGLSQGLSQRMTRNEVAGRFGPARLSAALAVVERDREGGGDRNSMWQRQSEESEESEEREVKRHCPLATSHAGGQQRVRESEGEREA